MPLRFATLATLLLLAASPLLAGRASALTIQVDGQNFPGQVTASIELSYDGVDTLTVEITNTSSIVAAATGFAFNVPGAVTGVSAFTASGTGDDTEWNELFPPGNAPGGYSFDGGAGTGNNVAGGTVADGFDAGETATFTFTFTGDALALAALTVNDFVGETADGASGPADWGVRFQGIPIGEGSDFAVHVPAPGAAWLVGLALLGLRGRRR